MKLNLIPALLFSLAVMAQSPRDPVQLKYWPAPLYWQPTHEEIRSLTRPELFNVTKDSSPAQTPANALVFVAMTPCRLVDTRVGFSFTGAFGPPSLVGGATRAFPLQNSTTCSVPTTAQAYSLNITIIPPGQMFYLTIWPLGSIQPNVSTLNDLLGSVVANAAIVPAGIDAGSGSVNVFVSNSTDLIIDINGYYASPTYQTSTAIGAGALANNTSGYDDTANGYQALEFNNTGGGNTALGAYALTSNTAGYDNTATGRYSLQFNTAGNYNVAYGSFALEDNIGGTLNTAIGYASLQSNTTGSNNIAIGQESADNVSGGNSYNIHIGNTGSSADSGTIRIGTPGKQSFFYVTGISGTTTGLAGAVPVVIDANGQLGTISSSARFKEDINDMADASSGLLDLHPVTFRYKQPYADGSKPIDYGLIAEEVAEIYPDLVVRDVNGQIQTVQYQKLTPMLINELQKQHQLAMDQRELIRKLEDRLAAVEVLLAKPVEP